MKLIGDKVLIRITKQNRNSIFEKEIKCDDGRTVKLFVNVPAADAADARRSALFVQTGVIEEVSRNVENVEKGDIAIIDYTLCNADEKLFYNDENGDVYWCNATTTYHKDDHVIYANRKNPRDIKVWSRGDYDEVSPLIGVIRNDKLIARDPFIFLEHLPTIEEKETATGLILPFAKYNRYDTGNKDKNSLDRKVLACSKKATQNYGIEQGDIIRVNDSDVFNIKYGNSQIDCVNDRDIICRLNLQKNISDRLEAV